MAVVRRSDAAGGHRRVEVLDAAGIPVPVAGDFLAHLSARGCSPNTVLAYGSDLGHLWRFLDAARLGWDALTPERAMDLLAHLRATPARLRGQPRMPALATCDGEPADAPGLSPATVNRALAAVSSFYDWAILAGRFDGANPIVRVVDRALVRAADRHRPFLAGISRQLETRRALQVKTVRRLPRPLDESQVAALLTALRCRRDLALVRLMLDGGLRPGEALGLHLSDIAYGRRRVTIRHRETTPGACGRSRAPSAWWTCTRRSRWRRFLPMPWVSGPPTPGARFCFWSAARAGGAASRCRMRPSPACLPALARVPAFARPG